jgi:hypothetical protein
MPPTAPIALVLCGALPSQGEGRVRGGTRSGPRARRGARARASSASSATVLGRSRAAAAARRAKVATRSALHVKARGCTSGGCRSLQRATSGWHSKRPAGTAFVRHHEPAFAESGAAIHCSAKDGRSARRARGAPGGDRLACDKTARNAVFFTGKIHTGAQDTHTNRPQTQLASYRELKWSYGVPRPVERIQRLLLHVRVTGFACSSHAFPSRHLWGSRAS